MRIIKLDASGWKTLLDFYEALLVALEAPHWHGRNINALIDSMVYGGINGIEPPYTVLVTNLTDVPKAVCEEVSYTVSAIQEARQERFENQGVDVEVSISAPELAH